MINLSQLLQTSDNSRKGCSMRLKLSPFLFCRFNMDKLIIRFRIIIRTTIKLLESVKN